MKPKALALLLTACLVLALAAGALAAFDQSLFQESDGFVNRVDQVVGVGSIGYLPEQEQPIGQVTSDNDYVHLTGFDVFFMPGAPAVIRAHLAVAGTLVNAKTLTLQAGESAYTLTVDSHPSTSSYETVTVTFSSPALSMLDEVLKQELTDLPFRLTGDFDIEGIMPINRESLETLYTLYQQAGGLQQDFTAVDEKYAVSMEE